jgi:hypothetical protein
MKFNLEFDFFKYLTQVVNIGIFIAVMAYLGLYYSILRFLYDIIMFFVRGIMSL